MNVEQRNKAMKDPYKMAIQRSRMEREPQAELPPGETPAPEAKFDRVRPTLDVAHLNRERLVENRVVCFQERSPMTTGFDLLRTKLQMALRERKWQTVMITSPTAQCGKTVTAINLAMSLARQKDLVTVLADFDFRHPSIARYLGVNRPVDVKNLIRREASVNEVLFTTDVSGPGLRVLATMSPVSRPAEILASAGMADLIDDLKASVPGGIILFDMPPILGSDDVLSFLPNVDGVLLLAASGHTKSQELIYCRSQIPEEKLIGIVFSKSSERSEDYYYY